jgi:thiol-disulfide isomerase/thioredoxin
VILDLPETERKEFNRMKALKKRLLFGLGITLLVALSFVYFSGCGPEVTLYPPDLPSPSDIRPKGKVDYGWTLRRLNGTEVTFSQFKGKVVFLNFWATWCPPCTVELPNIQRLHESLKTKDVVFVVSSYEDENVVRDFISSKRLKRHPGYICY